MLDSVALLVQPDEVVVDVGTSAMLALVMLKSTENTGWFYHSVDETMWSEHRFGYQN